MGNNSSSSSSGIGFSGLLTVAFSGLLTVAFIVLKLCGVINWSWWWVLSPIWISMLLILLILLIVVIVSVMKK
jgi:hypothetical protein